MEPFSLPRTETGPFGVRRGEATPTAVDTEAVAETTSNCPNVHHDGSHGRPRKPTSQSSNRQPGNQSHQSAISQSNESDTPALELEQPRGGRSCRRHIRADSRGPARQIYGSSLVRLLPIISPTLVPTTIPSVGACDGCTSPRRLYLGRPRGGLWTVPGPSRVLHTLTFDTQLSTITYMAGSSPAIHVECDVRHTVPSAIAQPDLHCLGGPARSAWLQNGNVNMARRSKSVMHAAEHPKRVILSPSRRPKYRYQTLDAWFRLDAGVEPIFSQEPGARSQEPGARRRRPLRTTRERRLLDTNSIHGLWRPCSV
ncbi:hypothetical protein J3E71DRAFT_245643 [Bipolaris maydis]|nr:hypothetical protein J3E71DRAFT_245643 [Bipolaris maydis]